MDYKSIGRETNEKVPRFRRSFVCTCQVLDRRWYHKLLLYKRRCRRQLLPATIKCHAGNPLLLQPSLTNATCATRRYKYFSSKINNSPTSPRRCYRLPSCCFWLDTRSRTSLANVPYSNLPCGSFSSLSQPSSYSSSSFFPHSLSHSHFHQHLHPLPTPVSTHCSPFPVHPYPPSLPNIPTSTHLLPHQQTVKRKQEAKHLRRISLKRRPTRRQIRSVQG